MTLLEVAFIVITATVWYRSAWIYFKEGLFVHRDVLADATAFGESGQSVTLHTAGRIFAATFALSLCIFELIIVEIAGIMRPEARALAWRAGLCLMAVNLHVVTPTLIAYSWLAELGTGRRYACYGACLLLAMFTSILWCLDNYLRSSITIELDDDVSLRYERYDGDTGEWKVDGQGKSSGGASGSGGAQALRVLEEEFKDIGHHFLSLEASLARIGVFGVLLLAVVSGFGGVNYPFERLSAFFSKKVTASKVASRARTLRQTLSLIGSKKIQLLMKRSGGGGDGGGGGGGGGASRTSQIPDSNTTGKSSMHYGSGGGGSREGGTSWWWLSWLSLMMERWLRPHVYAARQEEALLKTDIQSLEFLAQEQFIELIELRDLKEQAEEAQSFRGAAKALAGVYMLGFCLYKLTTAAINVIFKRPPGQDSITKWMGYALQQWNLQIDVQAWSQLISFLLIGILVLLQTRGFLLDIMKITRASTAWGLSAPAPIVALVFAQIMGTYFTSSVLLIRVNLPHQYQVAITAALGEIRFTFYHQWFDSIFFLSCCFSALLLLVQRQARQSSHHHDDHEVDDDVDNDVIIHPKGTERMGRETMAWDKGHRAEGGGGGDGSTWKRGTRGTGSDGPGSNRGGYISAGGARARDAKGDILRRPGTAGMPYSDHAHSQ